jgi:hypothetical protein
MISLRTMRISIAIQALVFVLLCSGLQAQSDTLGRYSPGFKFKDGLYLGFEDFKSNCPAIPLKELRDREGKAISEIQESQALYHIVEDTLRYIDPALMYGFSAQGKVSIGHDGNFDRLVVIGTLCHVIQREIVVDYARGGLYEFNSMPVRREVRKEFILDMRTGEMSPMNSSNMDYHIADDSAVATSFSNQSQKQRKATVYSTLHAYNREHPMYFSISRCK